MPQFVLPVGHVIFLEVKMKKSIAFVQNFCTHYTKGFFETLSKNFDIDFLFYSIGGESYWMSQHGYKTGDFNYEYLPGFRFRGIQLSYILPIRLLQKKYHVYIASINGRFALPITYLIARYRRKPFILWTGIWMRIQTPAHRLFFRLTRYIYRHSNAVVVYGEHIRRYLISEGVDPGKIFIASHAIDNELYRKLVPFDTKIALRNKLEILPESKIILYLGRLEDGKGIPYLLEALRQCKDRDAVLVLAGDGEEREFLETQAREMGIIDKIRFAGYVPIEKAIEYYSIAWLFVLPSITTKTFKEPWGLVINEAFNQGVPVVVTDAVGAAAGGLVEDEINGLIVPERDSVALGKAIDIILSQPELRASMSSRCREKIYSWNHEKMANGFHQAINSVINNK